MQMAISMMSVKKDQKLGRILLNNARTVVALVKYIIKDIGINVPTVMVQEKWSFSKTY